MSNFGAILTNAGAAKLANAIALGVPLKLTQMAVGDGNGQPVTPDPAMTAIPGEKRRAAINTLFPDPLSASQLVAEQIIPEDVGGWWIRCVGLYDDSNTLIAVANVPDTYKPLLASGAGRTQIIRMVLIVSDTNSVELKIDPAVVLATRKYVDDVMKAHKESRDHPDASESAKGFVKLATQDETDAGQSDNIAVTPKKLRKGISWLIAANGYIVFPSWLGGIIIQWGEFTTPQSGVLTVNYPISFPRHVFSAYATANQDFRTCANIATVTLSSMRVRTWRTDINVEDASAAYWMAIGV